MRFLTTYTIKNSYHLVNHTLGGFKMIQFTAEQTPAEIVKMFPKASDLFKQRKINFCCSGDRPLTDVFIENSLDGATVLSELNIAYEDWKNKGNTRTDWDTLSLTELTDYITEKYHDPMEQELLFLDAYVTRVFKVHGGDSPHLKELHHIYNLLQVELTEHMIKENNEVFPLIKEYELKPSENLLAEIHTANKALETEHEKIVKLLKEIREVTNDFTPPQGACNTYQMSYARLAELESETYDHIHLENNILFERL